MLCKWCRWLGTCINKDNEGGIGGGMKKLTHTTCSNCQRALKGRKVKNEKRPTHKTPVRVCM
jgi:hypothetical protein